MLLHEQQTTSLNFSHSAEVPFAAIKEIWKIWSDLSDWHSWDASLKGTEASANGLFLGKRFFVMPKSSPLSIPVTVTSFEKEHHFTTTSVSPMGVLAFGHSLKIIHDSEIILLTHSLCSVTNEISKLPDLIWDNLQADVYKSVESLAKILTYEGNK